jgi:predicted MPP superfamily phosphohydrolase
VVEISRRNVLKGALALAAGVATGTLGHGYWWERHALGVTRVDLPMSGLPGGLDGLRIGFITDLHHSEIVSADEVSQAVALLIAEGPDLAVLGGDYVSFADRRFMAPVAERLAALEAPQGIFAIVGNHDDERNMPAELRRRGIPTLMDDRTTLEIRGERMDLAGLKFWTRTMDDIVPVLRGSQWPVLLLAHDPRRIVEAAALGVPGLLAGHPHGGQIVLPVLGAVAARRFPVAAGRLTRKTTEMFVSRGVGTVVVPIRVNCPPEVAVVTLRRPARQRL